MILNLADPQSSDIQFKVSKFPDGQQNVEILPNGAKYSFGVTIKSRMNDFKDLELIICATACLRELGVRHIKLFVGCFLGQRSDRKFIEGGNNYLKQVICPIINAQNYSEVKVHTPHSDVLEACLNNFKYVNQNSFLYSAYLDIFSLNPGLKTQDDYYLVSPDAGALKRTYAAAESFDNPIEVLTCSKHRDPITGKITGTFVPEHKVKKVYIILDDLVDGGKTFLDLSQELRITAPKSRIYLVASHGVFSRGFEAFYENFDRVYCTNSVSNDYVEWDKHGSGKQPKILKTINIF